jgi:hypothetical protein
MSKASPKIEMILELMTQSGIEIVSFGLAPNPNGFCYECADETTNKESKKMSELLSSLNNKEVSELKGWVF